MKDARLYLIHIRECVHRIKDYTRDGCEAFLTDTKTQDAVLHNLQTLGESTQALPGTLKTAHPEIDWRAIARFRNVLVHHYLGVKVERIWEIVEQYMPTLKQTVGSMMKEHGLLH